MIPYAIYEGIYYQTSVYSLNPLIIGSTITAIVTFIKNKLVLKKIGNN